MDAEELPDADLEIGATKSNRMVFASGSSISDQHPTLVALGDTGEVTQHRFQQTSPTAFAGVLLRSCQRPATSQQ
jgi:hypothetical protein